MLPSAGRGTSHLAYMQGASPDHVTVSLSLSLFKKHKLKQDGALSIWSGQRNKINRNLISKGERRLKKIPTMDNPEAKERRYEVLERENIGTLRKKEGICPCNSFTLCYTLIAVLRFHLQ